MISGVFQDMSVLSVTVAETVAQDTDNVDLERVKACIEKAGLTRKIEKLPKVSGNVSRYVSADLEKILNNAEKQAEQALQNRAEQDSLTKLLNNPCRHRKC